jgi:hypothetical protein
VRTAGPPDALAQPLRREVWAVDRNVAITDSGSLNRYLQRFSYAEPRLGLVILGVFATVGLVLVGLGVYSVAAYAVSRQTHEIGIRMALGASRARRLGWSPAHVPLASPGVYVAPRGRVTYLFRWVARTMVRRLPRPRAIAPRAAT